MLRNSTVVEIVLLIVTIIDVIFKLANHFNVVDSRRKIRTNASQNQEQTSIDYIFDSGFIYLKGEPVISSAIVFLDCFLVFDMVILFIA
jgi:hypothetical protein